MKITLPKVIYRFTDNLSMSKKVTNRILNWLDSSFDYLYPLYTSKESGPKFVRNEFAKILLSPIYVLCANAGLYQLIKAQKEAINNLVELCQKNNVILEIEYDRKMKKNHASGLFTLFTKNGIQQKTIKIWMKNPDEWQSSWTIFVLAHEYGHSIDPSFTNPTVSKITQFCLWLNRTSYRYQKKALLDPGVLNWLQAYEDIHVQREIFADKFAYDFLLDHKAEKKDWLNTTVRSKENLIQDHFNLNKTIKERFHPDDQIDWW